MFNRARSIVGNAVVFNFNSILIVRIETKTGMPPCVRQSRSATL